MAATPATAYDRVAELRALDATRAGVRGLVASGVTYVPRIFRVPDTDKNMTIDQGSRSADGVSGNQQEPTVPVIDLSGTDHAAMVDSVRRAAAEWGFFQVRRAMVYSSPVANWQDTLYLRMAPDPPEADELPECCREALFEYAKHVRNFGDRIFELLSEALGLKPSYLTDIECNRGQMLSLLVQSFL